MAENFETVISGSFKFKPEIDELIDEFADYNVVVSEPAKGWLYIASRHLEVELYRPLPTERNFDLAQIENRFLSAIKRCDFVYVNNLEQYIGPSVAFEMGAAHARLKPIFIREPLTPQNFDFDLIPYFYYQEVFRVASPAAAVKIMSEAKNSISV